ncbi:pyruvate formate-lyase-activating protein [Evansella cellulosilytica]|uniref:Pyruvate formate-lyase-activating enzyme n=1 Tax=Evansella cellulosilytica (strain ATCC 21833 / DSM 2522 / FERM P-1141 / JCM 9156 / N-4) TaxID=649639 RepID=E6U049_EVAC2|nr:pyruvate formate-lyase-activating protein [Evansella cellulosilytica]ADU29053.1 pyruvate formate-lyase activating enzyme [Evansella cellulosilytica DSM 2522]
MNGRIHSVETSGMVDGPGIRYVIFTQGCLLRCQYCHNPDTWDRNKGNEMTVAELIEDIKKYMPYMKFSKGGVTVSGGEPLLQMDFLIALFKECKKLGIHTTIDSSGGCYSNNATFQEKLKELFKVTDLFLVDLKHIDDEKHRKLTGVSNKHILDFATQLSNENVPVWIRHVLVPGISDDVNDLKDLSSFIKTLSNVEKIEILPYHKMGVYKWKELDLAYPLEGVEPPSEEQVNNAKSLLLN